MNSFLDEYQLKAPRITPKDLETAVQIFAKLEQSRSGYALLRQLSMLDVDDLEDLTRILNKWTVQDLRVVLDEIDRRLKLIETLEQIVDNPVTDELDQLQPLFGESLWMFGPEYESIEFMSNRSLATVIEQLLGSVDI